MTATIRLCIVAAMIAALVACATEPTPGKAPVSTDTKTAPAGTSLIDATDPRAIVRLMRRNGYEADLNVQQTGAVEIQSTHEATNFWLYFGACAPDFTECEVITLAAGFDFDGPQVPGLLGNWNEERYSKSYLDMEGDPFVEFTINMAYGVSAENFIDTLDWFGREITDFIDQIGWDLDDTEFGRPV